MLSVPGAPHFASALVLPVGDSVVELLGEDVPQSLQVLAADDGGGGVGHTQGGDAFTDLQRELGPVEFSCGGEVFKLLDMCTRTSCDH